MDVYDFWKAVLQQDAEKMRTYFRENAYVNWHCTNEHFSVEEGLISSLDEYWGDDGPAPQWRREKKIGSVIKKPEA